MRIHSGGTALNGTITERSFWLHVRAVLTAWRGWIPPLPLALAQAGFGFSWIVLFYAAYSGAGEVSFLSLAWIHTVALGWITLAALSILCHVIPGFTDLEWRGERVVRACLVVYAFGVALLVLGFLTERTDLLQFGGAIVILALLTYCGLAIATLAQGFGKERLVRTMARAFITAFLFLLAAAALGFTLAMTLGGLRLPGAVLANVPPAHAVLGIGGWLTLLTVGVSARTVRPIVGAVSRYRALHVISATALLVGTIVAALGTGLGVVPVSLLGVVVLAIGALFYAMDMMDVILRATVKHRPPQLLMACAAFFAVVASLLAAGAIVGRDWGAAAVYAALVGWVGSAVMAHFHHIGVRVILTVARGEDDDTRPWVVLLPSLTWLTAALYEIAALGGTIGIAMHQTRVVEIGAACGFAAWLIMLANGLYTYRNAVQIS